MAKASLPLPSLLVHAVFLAASFFHPCCTAQPQGHTGNISAIEAAVRDRASDLLRLRDTTSSSRSNTSQLVDLLPLPSNLSTGGVVLLRASALRVRSNALWADGINATATGLGFAVPPRVVPAPFARRLTIVFERFAVAAAGNSTSSSSSSSSTTASPGAFAAPRRYALAAPVAGLLAYDAAAGPDAARVISLRALGAPVRVEFNDDLGKGKGGGGFRFDASTARCVTFGATGEVVARHAVAAAASGSGAASCAVTGTGHFGIAVRLPEAPAAAETVTKARWWWAWTKTVGVGAGGVVLGASVLVCVSVAGAVSWSRRRRREEMERRAVAGEELGRMTVRGSRMPAAKVVRTRPELEER